MYGQMGKAASDTPTTPNTAGLMSNDKLEKPYWFIVADESEAIVYETSTRSGSLACRCTVHNEAARKKTDQLISDRGGRSFDIHGEGRHTLQNEKADPKRRASSSFAKAVVQQLAAARERGECREFSLIAAPRFLGMLRDEVSIAKLGEPFITIDKNVVGSRSKRSSGCLRTLAISSETI